MHMKFDIRLYSSIEPRKCNILDNKKFIAADLTCKIRYNVWNSWYMEITVSGSSKAENILTCEL